MSSADSTPCMSSAILGPMHVEFGLDSMHVMSELGAYVCRVRVQSLRMLCASSESTHVVCKLGVYTCRVQAQSLRMSCASSEPTHISCKLGLYACRTRTWESTRVASGLGGLCALHVDLK